MIQKLSFSFSFICLGLMACVTTAQAQTANTYPNKPVKVVVGFAPGGAADYVARTISDSLGKSLGQPVIIENKAGAGSSIAAEAVSKSAPDGYTVLIASPSSISVNPALNSQPQCRHRQPVRVGGQSQESPRCDQLRHIRQWLCAALGRRIVCAGHRH